MKKWVHYLIKVSKSVLMIDSLCAYGKQCIVLISVYSCLLRVVLTVRLGAMAAMRFRR